MEQFSSSVAQEKDHEYNAFNSREFKAMLDGNGIDNQDTAEERITQKKRRLSCEQVKALEKMFEADNKIEQEQRTKKAIELGLQPRQIAVWFQNRRARCKTKQLERDYNLIKANYEVLKLSYDELQQQKQALTTELRELKVKLGERYTKCRHYSVEAEAMFLKPTDVVSDEAEPSNPNHGHSNNASFLNIKGFVGFSKEGLSDSDSSGVFNDDSNLNAKLLVSPASSSLGYECSSLYTSWMNCFQFPDPRPIATREYEQKLVEMEEQSLFSAKHESCNVFLSDQANTFY